MFIFIQEHWLPHYEASAKFVKDFKNYNFISTSSDMFTCAEDKMLESGPVWHGTAVAWDKSIDKNITQLPTISERFCGVKYEDEKTKILAYTAYLPTKGQDNEFMDVLSQLSFELESRNTNETVIIIGLDSNQSRKSTRCRSDAMAKFIEYFSLKPVLTSEDPTFHHNNQTSESQIDNILYKVPENSDVDIDLYKHLCKLNNFANLSSHDALVARVALPVEKTQKKEKDFSSTYTPFIVPKPKWNESGLIQYQKETSKKLKDLSVEFNQP